MRRLATLSVVAAIAAAGFGILLQAGIPQVPTGTWAPAGFLADARMDSETALLDDGRVLIIGGTGLTGALATVELFDTEGSWWLAAPMAVARTGHTATALADGRVLVTGGQNADGVTADAELYYPASDAWVAVPNMVEARAGHTATLLDDGRVLIAGGSSEPSFSVEIFDPATDSFTFAGSSPLVRTDHAAALLGDGRVLIAGGWSGGAATGAADIYDPAIGLLTPTTDLQVARIGHSATALIGGQVLIVGGRDGVTDLSSVEVFDPATETFAVVGSALAVARSGHRAFSLPNNNNVLVVGGRAAGVPLASAELFTPWTGALSATNAMGAARAGLTGSAVGQDGMLLVAGGATSESLHVSSELYGFATVKTDKDDYAPGQTVVITGGGWQPGETVTLLLQEYVSPAFHDDLVLTATADENGNILNTEFFPLQHDIGVRFYLTGTGQTTGWSAQTTFTDGPPKISLEQCRNGAAVSPNACSDLGGSVGWVNGNAGASQAHLLEGFSIPYRAVMENLPTGTDITVVFGYDIKHGGKHALDYLTHFARLDPHLVNFGHGPEMVTPKSGVSGISATTMTFPIPAPSSVSSCASDVGDQPATSFNALPAGQRLMTLFGGTITNVLYDGAQGCLTDAQAETQIAVSFTVVNPTAVLAWGGHIAKATDWGPGNSAGAISGSPFHMRLISWSLGNLGHQDRSLSAGAVISPGAITIVKDATPVGSTSFSFTGSPVPLTNFSLVDDGSATDTKVFSDITNFTTYTVTENTPPGWDLTGIGCVVAGENGGSQDINGATVTIDLKEGENVTCTFANTQQQGDLIVIKHVINDDGGTAVAADWTMDITGTNVSSTGFAGEEAPGVTVTLDAGAYSVDESGDPSGYTKSLSADCSGTIAAGETKTCTITNDDVAPTLKLVKEVINLDGGDAGPDDWTLTAISTGGDATRDISTLGGSGGFETVFANAVYDLAESPDPLTGYTTGSFSCVGGTQSGSTITLAEGETGVICTITNDDVAPTLKLVKEVINLDGGDAGPDDWTLTAISTGGDATRDISTLGGSGGFETVFANAVYDLAESPDPLTGYTTGSFSCVGGTQSGSTITLAEGETGVICTITNDDVAPTLKLVKEVINLDGGDAGPDDWTLTAISTGGDATRDISTLGGSGGFETVFANAVYDLAESPDPLTGYTTGSFSCVGGTQSGSTITLAEGETGVICTITNDDVAPTLKLVKEVINLDGGDAGPDDWTLTAISTGGDATRDISTLGGSGGFETVFANAVYDLAESPDPLTGYTTGSFSCVGGTQSGSTITLAEGETGVICTITNDDVAPTLKLVKEVINLDGGDAGPDDWTLTAISTGGDATRDISTLGGSGGFETVFANAVYDLAESPDPLTGYTTGSFSCVGGTQSGSTITLAEGETGVICTITNDDVAPTLKLVKEVINLDGGDAGPDDWTLTAISTGGDATRDISTLGGSGGFETVFANAVYDLAESPDPLTGYTTGSFSCVGGTQSGSTITLAEGETGVICTITNDDVAPTLKLVKEVINLDGGDAGPDDWTLTAISTGGDATRDISTLGGSGGFETVFANAVYDLAESPDPLTGYTTGSFSCVGGTQSGSTITLAEGETGVICTITNDDVAPTLKLVKEVINLDGGDAGPDDWTLTAISTGGDATRDISTLGGSGVFETVFANVGYDLSETGLAGYTAGSFSCVGGTLVGSTVTLTEGETGVVCTITNDDIPGTLIIQKVAVGIGLQTAEFDFEISPPVGAQFTETISVSGGGVQGQAAFTLSGLALGAPPHTVTELALPVNWVFTSLNCSLTGSGAGTSTFSTSGQTATVTLVGAGDTVTCVYTNTHVATRATQGFWSTHLNVMSNGQSLMNIISAIGLQLCGNPARVVDMVPELMGGFWSRISRTAGPPKGTRRNPLDQARMQLIQQLLAAVLNNHVFGADDEGAITAGEAAYCGTNRGAIIMAADALATFNESGGSAPFPDGFEQGSADPKTARSIADRPFWDMLP